MKQTTIEKDVKSRYAQGAEARQEDLCCPVDYNAKYLEVIPGEIIEKDYGCGDPSQFLKEGEVVLDLGSGGGKICYIASQVVGPKGKVIGVDFNPAMLELAEKHHLAISKKIGWDNVEFRYGKIQDLRTDYRKVEALISEKAANSLQNFLDLEDKIRIIKQAQPLIEDDSIDVIVSNCVLNLVQTDDKKALFKEMHRVLKRGGRVAISDIVSDEVVPQEMQDDPDLWSGCISGAFQEKEFLRAFEEAGFYGIKIEKRDENPWKTIQGIEFRSMTVTAYKGKEGKCWERNQAIVYKGPWKQVVDDDGHVFRRGERSAVCDKTLQIMSKAPYEEEIEPIEPLNEIPLEEALPFNCKNGQERDPRQTKGQDYNETIDSTCTDASCC